jgi:putative transposase
VGRIETRLTQSISEVCQAHQAELEKLEMMSDHVQLLVNVDPPVRIHRLVRLIKGRSSRSLRQKVPELKCTLPTLWTNAYGVSTTGGAPLSMIKQ